MSIILHISHASLSYLLNQSFKCSCLLSDQIEVTRKLKVVKLHFSLYRTYWQIGGYQNISHFIEKL